jgi:uncharacterized protein (DUF58 family)
MIKIKLFYQNLFFSQRFFYLMLGIAALFVVSYAIEVIYGIVWLILFAALGFTLLELIYLFTSKNNVSVTRVLPEKLSNGDPNEVNLILNNHSGLRLYVKVIDELPEQFQIRDFALKTVLNPRRKNTLRYQIRPTKRGVYQFGRVHVFASTWLGLVQRRFSSAEVQTIKCYPAFMALRNLNIRAIANEQVTMGSRKIRRIGTTMEFEQIKEYVLGDDIRTINWKSTAKRGQLMVNQFQDEKSQDIYVAIDTGRTMEMPFHELSLLDYSINSSLMLLSLVLAKYDRAGMFTFGKRMENVVMADKKPNQLQQIIECLYAIETKFEESNFAVLYAQLKRRIAHRSLIILYTNFESMDGMQRNLPFLIGMNKNHLLLVVFFKNKKIAEMAQLSPKNMDEFAEKIIASKMEFDKRLMVRELAKHGILSLLTAPEDLNVAVMNKYLEIKGRGLI